MQGIRSGKSKKMLWTGAGVAVLILLLALIWPVAAPFFFAMVFAYLLRPLINLLLEKNFSAGSAIFLIYALVFTVLALLIWLLIPPLLEQGRLLLAYLPELLQQLLNAWSALLREMERIPLPSGFMEGIDRSVLSVETMISDKISQAALAFPSLVKWLLYLLLAPVLSYYFLRDKGAIKRRLISWISAENRMEILRLAGDIDHLLRQFIYGYLLVSLVLAVLTAAYLSIIGVNYALVLGLLMGIADLIPYFGPFLGAIPAVLIALAESPKLALLTAAGLLMLQQLEGLAITPLIMGDRIGMHPLVTIFSVMAGAYFFGVAGAVLAVPAAASLSLILRYGYSRMVGYREKL
ncbi:MAG: AI-2E family transporter [Firmicutes bacterium]|nr:AI-2E family transporter [Bacillota bacterium]